MNPVPIVLTLALATLTFATAPSGAEPSRRDEARSAVRTGEIVVDVSNIRAGGRVLVALFDDAERFPSFTGQVAAQRVAASGPAARAIFRQLPYGRYAVAVVHDVNDNGRLDTRLGVLPAEPIGFSNNAKVGRFGPPSYADAAFELRSKRQSVRVAVD